MRNFTGESLRDHLCDFIGETVTIFTESGGQSGCGFTGVVIDVNKCFVRLITRIGPAPSCALGNACEGCRLRGNGFTRDRGACRCNFVGSVVDIPIDQIVAFVHNAV